MASAPLPGLAALQASIRTFISERRRLPASHRALALRDIGDLQNLLQQAAARLGLRPLPVHED